MFLKEILLTNFIDKEYEYDSIMDERYEVYIKLDGKTKEIQNNQKTYETFIKLLNRLEEEHKKNNEIKSLEEFKQLIF